MEKKKKVRYYIFSAGIGLKNNDKLIEIAKEALSYLLWTWDMNAQVTGIYSGSEYNILENDGGNYSIFFEDEDINRLIYSCVSWESKYTELRIKRGIEE